MLFLVLQVAVEATAGKRKKRRRRSGLSPSSLFTGGGAWDHAPPVVVARGQTRHQPPLHCCRFQYCSRILFCTFLYVYVFYLNLYCIFNCILKNVMKMKKNVCVSCILFPKCNEKEIKRECVCVLCCFFVCFYFMFALLRKKNIK